MKFLTLLHMVVGAAPHRFARARRPIRETAPNRRGTAITAKEARRYKHTSSQLQRAIAIASLHGNPVSFIDIYGVMHLLHFREPVMNTSLPPPVRHLRIRDIHDDGGHNSDFRNDFRFKLSDMEELVFYLDLPEDADGFVRTPRNGYKYSNEEGVLMWLYYFARAGTLRKMAGVFGGAVPRSSEIITDVTVRIHRRWHHRIVQSDLRHMDSLITLHTDALLERIGGDAAALPWQAGLPAAFVDAKCLKICRPSWAEDTCYSGYKHMHSMNFQILGRLDGIVEDIFGPVEGRHSDPYLFNHSNLEARFRTFRNRVWDGEYAGHANLPLLKMYADGIYALSTVMGRNFRAPFAPGQAEANALMATLRGEIEHMFAKVSMLFAQVHNHFNNKIFASPVGTQYIVAHILTNAHSCLYGNQTADYFNLETPGLDEYFS